MPNENEIRGTSPGNASHVDTIRTAINKKLHDTTATEAEKTDAANLMSVLNGGAVRS
jgi:hypothetical protein